MARFILDIETNGLLDEVSTIHCIVLKDIDSGERHVTRDFMDVIELVSHADMLVGHNLIGYDLPVLKKLRGWEPSPNTVIIDTLVKARLMHPDTSEMDNTFLKEKKLDGKLYKSHSLKAWGQRLGKPKGDFTGPWDRWSQTMQDYCIQDVDVTHHLYVHLQSEPDTAFAVALEHDVARLCFEIERNGILLNDNAAVALWCSLVERQSALSKELTGLFPPWQEPAMKNGTNVFVPKRDNAKLGYKAGVPVEKFKTTEFNPGSRDHISNRLANKYGWKPTEFTENGKPKVDETILASLPYPEAKKLAELFLLSKRIGQIATGDEAWLRKVNKTTGRIHARYNPNGAVTGRAAHFSPNIAQVPKVGKPFGAECRAMFIASPGYKMLGADLQGLELRCLGHYMSRWDGGKYAGIVVSGDPHTANMDAMQLDEFFPDRKVRRDKSKTIVYAVLYGAGDGKVGSIVGKGPQVGRLLKTRLKQNLDGFGALMDTVSKRATSTGVLKGIDGRTLYVRSSHAALNTLLQSCGAILCKRWITNVAKIALARGYKHGVGKDFAIVAWVHDEIQVEVKEGLEQVFGDITLEAAKLAGAEMDFVPPLEAEFKVGNNWAETH